MSKLFTDLTHRTTVAAVSAIAIVGGYIAASLMGISDAVGALDEGFLLVLGFLFGRARPDAS